MRITINNENIITYSLSIGLLFMMGNKIDEEREVSEDDADQLCESLSCKQHFLVSVKTGKSMLREELLKGNIYRFSSKPKGRFP